MSLDLSHNKLITRTGVAAVRRTVVSARHSSLAGDLPSLRLATPSVTLFLVLLFSHWCSGSVSLPFAPLRRLPSLSLPLRCLHHSARLLTCSWWTLSPLLPVLCPARAQLVGSDYAIEFDLLKIVRYDVGAPRTEWLVDEAAQ